MTHDEMLKKATPRPWEFERHEDSAENVAYITGADTAMVAELRGCQHREQNEANAVFASHAVSQYERLICSIRRAIVLHNSGKYNTAISTLLVTLKAAEGEQ